MAGYGHSGVIKGTKRNLDLSEHKGGAKGVATRRKARQAYEKAAATTKPGEGSRFAAIEKSAKLGGATNPAAVAAAIGRRKYGKKRFQQMAVAGKKAAK